MIHSYLEAGMFRLAVVQAEIVVSESLPFRGLYEDEVDAVFCCRVEVHHAIVGRDVDASYGVSFRVDIRGSGHELMISPYAGAYEHQGDHQKEGRHADIVEF